MNALGIEIGAILDGVPSGIAVLRERKYVWVNAVMADISGYAEAELVGATTGILYAHHQDFERVGREVEQAFAKGGGYETNILIRRKDAALRWMNVSGKLVSPQDPARGSVWFMQDITERRRVEDELQYHRQHLEEQVKRRTAELSRRQAQLQTMLNAIPGVVGYWDKALRNQFANPAYREWLGLAPEQIEGRHFREVFGPERYTAVLPHIGAVLQGQLQKFEGEFRQPGPAGRFRYAEIHYVPDYSDGAVVGFFVMAFDITERKNAERALQHRTEQLDAKEAQLRETLSLNANILRTSPVGIAAYRQDGRCVMVNPTFANIVGGSDEQMLSQNFRQLESWRRSGLLKAAENVLATGLNVGVEAQLTTTFGRRLWLNCKLSRFVSAGEPHLLLMFHDVTEQKSVEAELRTAKAAAERANNAKSRFLAAASHDLRQPLSALSLYVGALGDKLAPADAPMLANMKDSVASLSEMLSNLLDLSKLEAGVVTANVTDFALDEALNKVIAAYAPEAQVKQLALRCTYFGRVGRTDRVLFQRILGNLVANAIRYTVAGGVLVGCRRRQGKTWVEVWDTGIGIPPDKTAEIFEEFKQLGNHERNRAKGSGLGLAIVAKTAALLGLEIRVRSRPGMGSLFAVEIPLGAAIEPSAYREYAHRPLRIALVEDNREVATALAYALTNIGHQVVAAASRTELLPQLNGTAPDIVISDYRLAGKETGIDVIRAVRAAFGGDLPAVIITGDTDAKLIRSMADTGIRLQHKPLEIEALRAIIAEVTG